MQNFSIMSFLTSFNLYLRMISNKEDHFYFSENSFSLFTAYQILRSERKNCLDFLSAILKCRIEKQNCTLRGSRKENWQSIWLFWRVMLYYLHANEYVHGYVVFNFSQSFWLKNGTTTCLTIYGFGLRGNSGDKSTGKHRLRTRKTWKCLESK